MMVHVGIDGSTNHTPLVDVPSGGLLVNVGTDKEEQEPVRKVFNSPFSMQIP